MDYQFIDSKRGGQILVVSNYQFRLSKRIGAVRYWICMGRETHTCQATARTDGDILTSTIDVSMHPHSDDSVEIKRRSFKAEVKQEVLQNPNTSVKRSYSNLLLQKTVEESAVLPTFSSIKTAGHRVKASVLPQQPALLRDLTLNPPWNQTADGRPMVLVDDGMDDKIIILCTAENFERLCHAQTVWMDGTFKCCPRIFTQMYTIHIKILNQFFPVLTAFLPDKTELTYRRMLQLIQRAAANLNRVFAPQTVHTDFEQSVINAVRLELNVTATGCLFHFSQCLYRKLQSIGLQVSYNTDNPVGTRRWLRRLMALPLLPPLRLQGVYTAIVQAAPNLPEAAIMHAYMWATFVDPVNALFDIQLWNLFNSVDRTTNICEGFHSAINQSIGVYHPTIFKILKFFQDLEATQEREIAQLAFGAPPKKRKATYVRVDERIAQLTDQTFGNVIPNIGHMLHYLDAVSFQLWDLKH